jgi:hypothetical protein
VLVFCLLLRACLLVWRLSKYPRRHSQAEQGTARGDKTRQGTAKDGRAGQAKAGHSRAWQGTVQQDKARLNRVG